MSLIFAMVLGLGGITFSALCSDVASGSCVQNQAVGSGDTPAEHISETGFSPFVEGVIVFADSLNIESYSAINDISQSRTCVVAIKPICARESFTGHNWRGVIFIEWQKCSFLTHRIFISKAFSHHSHFVSWRLTGVHKFGLYYKAASIIQLIDGTGFNPNIGPKLTFSRVTGDSIRINRKTNGDSNGKEAKSAKPGSPRCPPGSVSGCVRRLPLGAQIVIALIFLGAAWLAFDRAFRPFGQLIISRRDIRQAIGYGLLSLGLFAISAWTWMLPG